MDISYSALIAVLAAGAISFLSPCVLPLVPGYLSYVAGQSIAVGADAHTMASRLRSVVLSVCFVLGFSTVFVIFGASATALGQSLISFRYELNLVGGVVVVLFGLFTLGLLRPAWLLRDVRFDFVPAYTRPTAAYLLGAAFAFGWTPCIGPMLGAILTVSAASATVGKGVAFLAVYSLGLGLPFLIAAAFTDSLAARLKSFARLGRVCQRIAGSIMIILGAAMITGKFSTFSYWLLDRFPLLATIG